MVTVGTVLIILLGAVVLIGLGNCLYTACQPTEEEQAMMDWLKMLVAGGTIRREL
jgi:hypothetical protein